MDHRGSEANSEARFAAYVEDLVSMIGHADRAKPLRDYCTGLMMPCERKSVEPMAAITAPHRTAAQHQSLLHFVGEGKWSDERVLAKVRARVVPAIERHGAIEVLRGVSLSIARGEVAAVIGSSGSGKSTFLRCLNGLERFQSGWVTIDGLRFGEQRLIDGRRHGIGEPHRFGVRRLRIDDVKVGGTLRIAVLEQNFGSVG